MNGISALIRLVLDKVSTKKVTDDIAGALKEGGKKGGAEFSESVMSRARTMLSGGGDKKKIEDVGVKLAQSIRAGFDREMADIKVARAGKLISDSEAARQGQAAAEHYRKAALAALDRGDISDKGITRLTGTLKHVETQGRKAGETYAQSVGNGIKKWAAGVAASVVALFAVRQIISFVKDSVSAFMESNRASEAMQESARQAAYAWDDFKASVGEAVVTMLGGEAGVDSIADRLRDMAGWVSRNRDTWYAWGENVTDALAWVGRDIRATVKDFEALQRGWNWLKDKAADAGAAIRDAMGGSMVPNAMDRGAGGSWNSRAPGATGKRTRLDQSVLDEIRATTDLNALLERQIKVRRALNDERAKANPIKHRVDALSLELTEVGTRLEEVRAGAKDARSAETAARKAQREMEAAARKAERDARKSLRDQDEAATRRMQAEDRRFNQGPGFVNTIETGRTPGISNRRSALAIVEAMDAQQAKARETAEVWRDAHRDMENATQNVAVGIMDSFGSAIEMMVTGAGTIGDAFAGLGAGIAADILGGLKQIATAKVAENIARAFEAFAMGFGFTALQKYDSAAAAVTAGKGHLAAAAKWGALGAVTGGASGAFGGMGSGRGGDAHRGAGIYGREAAGNTQPQNITYVYVDPFNPKNPVHSRQIGKAVDLHVELAGRPEWARKGPNP